MNLKPMRTIETLPSVLHFSLDEAPQLQAHMARLGHPQSPKRSRYPLSSASMPLKLRQWQMRKSSSANELFRRESTTFGMVISYFGSLLVCTARKRQSLKQSSSRSVLQASSTQISENLRGSFLCSIPWPILRSAGGKESSEDHSRRNSFVYLDCCIRLR